MDAPYDKISWKFLTFWPLSRGYFCCWGCASVAVAVVQRFKLETMYGLSAGTKKCGRCREVAVIGGSTVFNEKSWSCDISKFELFVCGGRFRRNSYRFFFLETTSCRRSSIERSLRKPSVNCRNVVKLNPLNWLHCIRQVILVTPKQLIFFARSSAFKGQTLIIWNS